MRKTLTKVAPTTIPPKSDSSKEHLDPAYNRIRFTYDAVRAYGPRSEGTFMDMEFEVDSK